MDIVVIAIITLFLPYLIVFNERSQILDHIGMIKLLNKFQKDKNINCIDFLISNKFKIFMDKKKGKACKIQGVLEDK